MGITQIKDALAKLERLSASRAERVVSLIDDLAELEALETTADLAAAHRPRRNGRTAAVGARKSKTRCPIRSFSADKLRSVLEWRQAGALSYNLCSFSTLSFGESRERYSVARSETSMANPLSLSR